MPRDRVLFRRPSPPSRGWVRLNWSRDPLTELDLIADSYRAVADHRIALLESQHSLYAGDEFEAYPVVFLYRHALELRLKAIVLAGSVFLREEGIEPMSHKRLKRHDLMPLYKEVCRIFEAMDPRGNHWDLGFDEVRSASDFEAIVREFDQVDGGSFAFRYSVGTDFSTPSLEENFEFDLLLFAKLMDQIVRALAGAPDWIRETMQGRWEAAYEAEQEAWANADYEAPEYDSADYEPEW